MGRKTYTKDPVFSIHSNNLNQFDGYTTFLCHILLPPSTVLRQWRGRTHLFQGRTRPDIRREPGRRISLALSFHQLKPVDKDQVLISPILSALLKARIEISSYYALIELRSTNILHAVQCILMIVVFHKAEPTRRFIESIKAHYQPLNLSASSHRISLKEDLNIGVLTLQITHESVLPWCRMTWVASASLKLRTAVQ